MAADPLPEELRQRLHAVFPRSVHPAHPPPPFPADVLPPATRAYCEASAAAIGVPVEMVAVPLLGFAGAAIGHTRCIVLKPGYRQYPTLYLATVAPPGSAKTPAQNAARRPLDELQRTAFETHQQELQNYESELEAWKQRPPDARGHKPTRPRLEHYFSTNLTLEALVSILDSSPGVAISRDEIVSWVLSLNQYRGGKGSDRQEFLSLWAGAPIKVDRKGGEPLYVPHPVAAVIGGIQPEFVPDLHDEAQRRDGFVERILFIVPDVAPAEWTEATVPDTLLAEAVAVFRAVRPQPRDDDDGTTQLHPVARDVWRDWFNENQRLVQEAHGLTQGFYAKLPNQVARLALILHCLWNPDDPRRLVSRERLADAITLGEYFRQHLDRMLPLLGAPSPQKAAGVATRIMRVLERAPDDSWITRSALYRSLGNVLAEEMENVLTRLCDDGAVQRRTRTTATKPIEEWRIAKTDPGLVFVDSQYSPTASPNGRETGNNENTKPPSEQLRGIDATVRNLLQLTPDELAAYRDDLNSASPDDPHLTHDRAALARADAILIEHSTPGRGQP